ncbi:GntR family transcriptional regulator [Rhodococcus qingshengii]|uniref:GntR family transcriptional regulator n=1 Tax=Rhodococcus qingshengii TaxID=334542 RepID=UPI0035D9F128
MGNQLLEPVVQESTPSLIARRLRQAIGRGFLLPGQQLNEASLAKELGVSRGPLREAMQRLTQEGLLVSIRNRGLFVIEVTDDDVRDMYLARTAVERAAAAKIIEDESADAGRRLMEAATAMRTVADSEDKHALTEADIAFHALLVELAGSARLSRMHKTLMVETRMCITALETRYRSHKFRLKEHMDIAKAVHKRDAPLADRLLIAHMEDAVSRLSSD